MAKAYEASGAKNSGRSDSRKLHYVVGFCSVTWEAAFASNHGASNARSEHRPAACLRLLSRTRKIAQQSAKLEIDGSGSIRIFGLLGSSTPITGFVNDDDPASRWLQGYCRKFGNQAATGIGG